MCVLLLKYATSLSFAGASINFGLVASIIFFLNTSNLLQHSISLKKTLFWVITLLLEILFIVYPDSMYSLTGRTVYPRLESVEFGEVDHVQMNFVAVHEHW